MEAGGGGVAITASGKAFHAVVGEFADEDVIGQEGEVVALDGKGEGFDEGRLAGSSGDKGVDGESFLLQGFDVGCADAIGFGIDGGGLPAVVEGAEASALERPTDLIEAVIGEHLTGERVDHHDDGVVILASPIDTETGTYSGERLSIEGGGGGFANGAEDLTGVVIEVRHVFFEPDAFGCLEADGIEFGGVDEGIIKGGVVEASP